MKNFLDTVETRKYVRKLYTQDILEPVFEMRNKQTENSSNFKEGSVYIRGFFSPIEFVLHISEEHTQLMADIEKHGKSINWSIVALGMEAAYFEELARVKAADRSH